MILFNITLILLLIFALLFYTSLVNCNQHEATTTTFLWERFVNISTNKFERAFLPSYVNFDDDFLTNVSSQNSDIPISEQCRTDIGETLRALRLREAWAVSLFNSWAQFPPVGLLAGSLTDFGDYDQCLASVQESKPAIEPQYCLLDLALPMPELPKQHNFHHKTASLLPPLNNQFKNVSQFQIVAQYLQNGSFYRHLERESSVFFYMTLKMGICLPKSCTTNDIEAVTKDRIKDLGIDFKGVRCENRQDNENLKLNWTQIGAIIFIVVICLVSLVAAIYDHQIENKRESIDFLLWFSPIRNVRKLMSTNATEQDDLSCIHAFRFINIVWIIIAHTLEWNGLNMYRDSFILKNRLSQLNLQPLFKVPYAVETFFYLSGLLTSYVTLKFTRGEYRNFRYMPFVVLRYLRLTPQLFAFLWLTSLLPPLFDGPVWHSYMERITDKCYPNWWHIVLYMQNVIDVKNLCAWHTWYLANDMQLHWMSLLPVVFLLRNRSTGIIVTVAMALVCVLISSTTIFMENFPHDFVVTSKTDFLDQNGDPSHFVEFYYKPWNHAIVFFVGLIFGSFISDGKVFQNVTYHKSTRYCLWALTLSGYLFVMYSTTPYLYGQTYRSAWSALLSPLNRTIWSAVLCLLIWLCNTGNFGLIGQFLSWPGFRPLSRMTYSVYLSHAWVMWATLGTRRDLIDIGHTYSMLILCCGTVVVSFMVGFVFTVLLEAPVIGALGSFKRKRVNQESQRNDLNENSLSPKLMQINLLETEKLTPIE